LIWYGRLWKILSESLDKEKLKYIIIENDISSYKEWKRYWKPIIFWNAFKVNTLKSLNIQDAKTVLISIWKSKKLYLVTSVVKKLNIKWNIIIKVNSFEEENKLKELNIKNIIVETENTALSMMKKV
jgi:CPA2 family monovalent cation:H+ antiporter-2